MEWGCHFLTVWSVCPCKGCRSDAQLNHLTQSVHSVVCHFVTCQETDWFPATSLAVSHCDILIRSKSSHWILHWKSSGCCQEGEDRKWRLGPIHLSVRCAPRLHRPGLTLLSQFSVTYCRGSDLILFWCAVSLHEEMLGLIVELLSCRFLHSAELVEENNMQSEKWWSSQTWGFIQTTSGGAAKHNRVVLQCGSLTPQLDVTHCGLRPDQFTKRRIYDVVMLLACWSYLFSFVTSTD